MNCRVFTSPGRPNKGVKGTVSITDAQELLVVCDDETAGRPESAYRIDAREIYGVQKGCWPDSAGGPWSRNRLQASIQSLTSSFQKTLPSSLRGKPTAGAESVNMASPIQHPITVYFMRLGKRPVIRPRKHRRYVFEFGSQSDSDQFADSVRRIALPQGGNAAKQRTIMLLLNPFGGTKRANSIFESVVKPMFTAADINVRLLRTEGPLHAKKVAQELEIGSVDALVTLSGDGLFHEVVNGLVSRSDWAEAVKIPIGIIPGGSGNALAKSIDTMFPDVATLNIIKGFHRPFDLFAFRHLNAPNAPLRVGHMGFMWALIADVDIESDRIRWAGSARFTLWALLRILRLRRYRAKLSFPPDSGDDIDKTVGRESAYLAAASFESNLRYSHIDSADKVPAEWKSTQALFTYFMAFNVPFCSTDYLVSENARLNDGQLTLVTLHGEDGKGPGMLASAKVLLGGRVADLTERQVKAFILEPLRSSAAQPKGILDLDGERVGPYGGVLVEVLPALANLIIPDDYHEDQWK